MKFQREVKRGALDDRIIHAFSREGEDTARAPLMEIHKEIETYIVEVPSEEGPYGARGVGEPSIIPGAAAISNAVEDAIGARVTEAPITPERVLRALGKI